jgi:hypothetical protein
MKRILVAMTVLTALTCANASAQTAKVNANIPFNFQMGTTLMPAGEYAFRQNGHVLTVHPLNGGSAAMILTMPAWRRAVTGGRVQFRRYGDSYFLTGIWLPNSQDGLTVPQSAREKELARHIRVPQATSVALSKQ